MRQHLITRTETQGRFGNGQGQEYAEQFLVEYWRDALQKWIVYKDTRGQKVWTDVSKSSCLYRASVTIKTLYYTTDAQIYNS